MAQLMCYKIFPTRRKRQNNDNILYNENCVQSQKTNIAYQKETAIPENILLKLTKIMINFQSNKCCTLKMHDRDIKKLKLKFT